MKNKTAIISYLVLLLFIYSNSYCRKINNDYSLLIALGLLQTLGDYWAKLYKVNPYIVTDPNNIYFLDIATEENIDEYKTKLILISGWNYNDTSNQPYPSTEDLKRRILNYSWNHLIPTTHFYMLLQNYEVFIFDYLTSDPVDQNGYRLRIWLDKLFYNSSNKVIIYAHSMGGIVSRFAVYYNELPHI